MARNRRGRERKDRSGGAEQLPWTRVFNLAPPWEMLAPEQLDAIDATAFTILEEVGLDFLSGEALPVLEAGGATVEPGSQRVRFGREVIRHWAAKAPATFMLKARDPAHDVGFGGREMIFSLIASAPNCSDLDAGRRPGSFADFCRFVQLGEAMNAVHVFGGYPVEPVDLPAPTRHLDCQRAFVELGTKAVHAYSLGRTRILDAVEIVKLGYGLDDAALAEAPRLISIINTSSPLRLDGPMIQGMLELAPRNQCVVITPFTLAGAMAPATVAGALAQQHAEALAGIAFYQMIHAGAPCVYGGFTSNVDMKSGAPAFGTPEYFRATRDQRPAGAALGAALPQLQRQCRQLRGCAGGLRVDVQPLGLRRRRGQLRQARGRLARGRAGLLAREGGAGCGADPDDPRVPDAHCHRRRHAGAGRGPRGRGPGGTFSGRRIRLPASRHAFYAPMISDWRNFESWQEAGAPDAARHANERAKALLAVYEQPPLDPGRKEAIDAFVERRKREGGVLSE